MKVKATRDFVSMQFGNVSDKQILEVTDARGDHLVKHKLAVYIDKPYIVKEKKSVKEKVNETGDPQPDPIPSTPDPSRGYSSQADRVSRKKTAKKSVSGKRKVKKGKSQ